MVLRSCRRPDATVLQPLIGAFAEGETSCDRWAELGFGRSQLVIGDR